MGRGLGTCLGEQEVALARLELGGREHFDVLNHLAFLEVLEGQSAYNVMFLTRTAQRKRQRRQRGHSAGRITRKLLSAKRQKKREGSRANEEK